MDIAKTLQEKLESGEVNKKQLIAMLSKVQEQMADLEVLKQEYEREHGLEFFCANSKPQKNFVESEKRFIWLFGGNRCLGGETLIYDPILKNSRPVQDIGEPFHVYAWDGKKLVIAKAEKPFQKEIDDLYEITLSNGKSFTCSMNHLILTSDGFQQVSGLPVGGEVFRPRSNLGLSQLIPLLDVRHFWKKALSFLNGCLAGFCSRDEQPLLATNTSRDVSPLSSGVREHISFLDCGREDDQDNKLKYSHICQSAVHPSSQDDQSQSGDQFFDILSGAFYKLCKSVLGLLPVVCQSKFVFSLLQSIDGLIRWGKQFPYLSSFTSNLVIISIVYKRRDVKWDFTVPQYHNYLVAGTIHHNSGKSVAGAVRTAKAMLGQIPGIPVPSKGWICSVDYETLQEVNETMLMAYIPKDQIQKGYPKGEMRGGNRTLKLKNGSVAVFKSYKQDVDSYGGRSLQWIWCDEQPPRKHYREMKQRVESTRGFIWITMTPTECLKTGGHLWVYRDLVEKYEKCSEDELLERFPDTEIIYISKYDNAKYLGEDVIQKTLLDMKDDDRELQVRVYGKWVKWLGRVFPNWVDSEPYVIPEFEVDPQRFSLWMAMDIHERIPFHILWLLVSKEGDYFIRDEYAPAPKSQMTIEDYAKIIKLKEQSLGLKPIQRFMDAAYCTKPQIKRSSEDRGLTFQEMFDEHKLFFDPWSRDKDGGITIIKELFKLDPKDNKPHLFITENCRGCRSQVKNYSWDEYIIRPEEKSPKQSVRKVDDHFIDCLIGLVKARPYYIPPFRKVRELLIDEDTGVVVGEAGIKQPQRVEVNL